MRVASLLLVAACGSAPPAPLAANRVPAAPATKTAKPWIDQHLMVGSREPNATRGSWTLTIDGTRAQIVATSWEAGGAFSLERADREAVWKQTETRTLTGPVRHLGDHIAYDLEGTNESLQLRCWKRSIVVAPAGAQRIHRIGHETDCDDPGTWNVATVHVDAMLCGFGEGLDDGQENGIDGQKGPLDETLFRFVEAPGIEFVEISEPCFTSNGLRLVKP